MTKIMKFATTGMLAFGISICLSSGAVIAKPAKNTVWDHNGSEMMWERKITGYTIRYLKPRPALVKLGVKAGDVLFTGFRLIKSIKGKAYTFRRGCAGKSFAYRVKGELVLYNAKGIVTLKGPPPIIKRCKVVGHRGGGRDSELKFTYLRDAAK